MPISPPCVVSLVWRLRDAQGQPIDELADPVEFLVGGEDLLPKVEEALLGHEVGDEVSLHLEPEHAFGDYDAGLVFFEDRAIFPESVEVGMQFDGVPEGAKTEGMPADAIYTVTEVYPDHVVLDGNHPLAGIALNLEVTVRDVRDATDDEIEAGGVGQPAVSVLSAPTGTRLH
jgi:FKBP-type peptidyl-prolyl cis-trans isomerase SlyD